MLTGPRRAIVCHVSASPDGLFCRSSSLARETGTVDPGHEGAGTLVVRQLESRGQQLVAAARLLADDVALKTAAAAADQESTRSVLASHRERIGAAVLMLVSPEGTVAADTLQPARLGTAFPLSPLLDEAERAGAASRIVVMGGGLYRLAFVPVRARAPIAWLCAGFALDARSADDLRRLTGLHVPSCAAPSPASSSTPRPSKAPSGTTSGAGWSGP